MKLYELLKDAMGFKAGTVFENCNNGLYCPVYKEKSTHKGIGHDIVENNPEWFRQIVETPEVYNKLKAVECWNRAYRLFTGEIGNFTAAEMNNHLIDCLGYILGIRK